MENNSKQTEIETAPDEINDIGTSMQNKLSSMHEEKNNKQKEETATTDEVVISMRNSLECFRHSSNSKCCIYAVPEFLRKEKKECYRPSVISIGPIFHGNSHLQTMEQLKWIYLDSFLKHPKNDCPTMDGYVEIVRRLNTDIRDCYQEQKMLSNDDEFVQMIVLDAGFLLCLILEPDDDNPLPLDNLEHPTLPKELIVLENFMHKDLLLEENQLPYFVLEQIFKKAFPHTGTTSLLIELTRRYIGNTSIGNIGILPEPKQLPYKSDNVEHLLDFWWKCCCLPIERQQKEEDRVDDTIAGNGDASTLCSGFWWKCCSTIAKGQPKSNPEHLPMTAKQLSAAGVKFKKSDGLNSFDIKFDKSNGELLIPKLSLENETETMFRSILFFELCHYFCENRTYFIDFVVFLDELIDTTEDIQILQHNGILKNILESDEEAAKLVNNIANNTIIPEDFNHSSVGQQVNAFASTPWNRWKAILSRDYFSHPWAIISFIFAIILFLLAIIQTINSFNK